MTAPIDTAALRVIAEAAHVIDMPLTSPDPAALERGRIVAWLRACHPRIRHLSGESRIG